MSGLLLDEMLSPRIAEALRADGVDIYAVADMENLRGTADPDVLELAAREERVLVTTNIKDFAVLERAWAAQGRTHAGILYVSSKTYPSGRAFIGSVTTALASRQKAGSLPAPGRSDFL